MAVVRHGMYARFHYLNDKREYHSDNNDKPSFISFSGTTYYHKNNKIHRSKKPSIIFFDGILRFYENSNYIKSITSFGKIK